MAAFVAGPRRNYFRIAEITGQLSESHPEEAVGEKLYSLPVGFVQEEELRFRLRSWQVNPGGGAPMNYDSLYPTFCSAAQARNGLGQRLRQGDPAAMPYL